MNLQLIKKEKTFNEIFENRTVSEESSDCSDKDKSDNS